MSDPARTGALPSIPSLPVQAPAARLGVAVVHQLVEVIVTGALKPGDLLPPEVPLTLQFGVSRTVIRESIKRLEAVGLVTVAQGRGTQVNPSSEWNLLDPVVLTTMIEHDDSLGILDELSDVRAGLESSMAAAAATERTDDQLAEIRGMLDTMQALVDDDAAFRQRDIEFHAAIMAASGSRLASSIARVLFRQALTSTRYHGNDPAAAFELTLAEHGRIADAIERRDAAEAERAMHDHIAGSWARRRLPVRGKA